MPSDEEYQSEAEKEEDNAEMDEEERGAEGEPEEIDVGVEDEAKKNFLEYGDQEDGEENKNHMNSDHERDREFLSFFSPDVLEVSSDAQNDQKQKKCSQKNIGRRLC